MHFRVYTTVEVNMLNCGVCAFHSSWGSGDAAWHRDMTPCLYLHVLFFPRAGRCKGADGHQGHFVPAILQRCLGVVEAAPRAQCTGESTESSWPPGPCPFNQEWGEPEAKEGQRPVVV